MALVAASLLRVEDRALIGEALVNAASMRCCTGPEATKSPTRAPAAPRAKVEALVLSPSVAATWVPLAPPSPLDVSAGGGWTSELVWDETPGGGRWLSGAAAVSAWRVG